MNLPARPFLGIDNDDRRELTAAGRAYLKGFLK
jgi:phage gpG-like protein